MRGLEAQLRTLVISNNSLSEANKSLTDTIAAITQRSYDLRDPTTVNLMPLGPGFLAPPSQTDRPPNASSDQTLFPAMPKLSVLDDPMIDVLHRCMGTVKELAMSISSAIDAWQGKTKFGSSDVHGTLARVTAQFGELPQRLMCTTCMRRPTWSDLGPAGGVIDSNDACACLTTPSTALWNAVDGSGRLSTFPLPKRHAENHNIDFCEPKIGREPWHASHGSSPSPPSSISGPTPMPRGRPCTIGLRPSQRPIPSIPEPQDDLDYFRQGPQMSQEADHLGRDELFDQVEHAVLHEGSPEWPSSVTLTSTYQSSSNLPYSTNARSYGDDGDLEAAASLDTSRLAKRKEATSDPRRRRVSRSQTSHQLDAKRAGPILRCRRVETTRKRVTAARNSTPIGRLTPGAAAPDQPSPGDFGAQGNHVMACKRSVGRSTTWAGSDTGDADKLSESRDMNMDTLVGGLSAEGTSSAYPLAPPPTYSAGQANPPTHHHGMTSSTASHEQPSQPNVSPQLDCARNLPPLAEVFHNCPPPPPPPPNMVSNEPYWPPPFLQSSESDHQHLMSATYIPSGNRFGPGIGLADHEQYRVHVPSNSPGNVKHLGIKRPRSPDAGNIPSDPELLPVHSDIPLSTPPYGASRTPHEVSIPEAPSWPSPKRRRGRPAPTVDATSALHSLLGRWIGGEASTMMLSAEKS